jgi:hypothetical protein
VLEQLNNLRHSAAARDQAGDYRFQLEWPYSPSITDSTSCSVWFLYENLYVFG